MTRIHTLLISLVLMAAFTTVQAERLTVAIPSSFVPFMFQEDGEWTGFEVELWETIADENDWEFEYNTMNFSGIITALQTGRVDAALHDTPNVLYYIETAGDGDVKAVGDNLEAQSYAMAFPRESELRNAVNITLLAMMEDGRYAELYERWFGEAPHPR